MRRRALPLSLALGTFALAGCKGCLELDEYSLVPAAPSTTSPTTGTTTSSAAGGGSCQASLPEGPLVAIGAGPPAAAGAPSEGCDGRSTTPGSVAVTALDAATGLCVARSYLVPDAGAQIDMRTGLSPTSTEAPVVGGAITGSGASLPHTCSGEATVRVPGDPAGPVLFVAQLALQGESFCTVWAQRITPVQGASLALTALAQSAEEVVVAGSLGGGCASFEGLTTSEDLPGRSFIARYGRSDGELRGVRTLPGSAGDHVLGLTTDGVRWLATGSLLTESCTGCGGTVAVAPAADRCPEPAAACPTGDGGHGGQGGNGAGGNGGGGNGAGGNGAGGNGAGGNGAGGAAPVDRPNAFLWRDVASEPCLGLDTYGRDGDASDAQAGYDLSTVPTDTGCATFWTGLAGLATWRLDPASSASQLHGASGETADGFLARLVSGGESCTRGTDTDWTVRLAADDVGARVWGTRVVAIPCSDEVVMTAHARDATTLTATRCQGGACATVAEMVLTAATTQLVVARLDATGAVRWYGAFGPVDEPPLPGTTDLPAARGDLAVDALGGAHVVLTTTAPLLSAHTQSFDCALLDESAPAGAYAIGLEALGFTGRAACTYARRLDE